MIKIVEGGERVKHLKNKEVYEERKTGDIWFFPKATDCVFSSDFGSS